MANPMPNPAESSPLDRYAAIEAAYREGDWDTVLEHGEALNRKLGRSGGGNAQALRQRLELMLAHTQLYGFRNTKAAQGHYQALLNQPVEASLRQMAEEGLQLCLARDATTASKPDDREPTKLDASQSETTDGSDQPSESEAATAAEPWLADLTAKRSAGQASLGTAPDGSGDTTLIPEVVEEPEQIEINQSNPSLADEMELQMAAPGQAQDLASLAAAAAAELTASASGSQPAADLVVEEPDPDLLACLRLVQLS